MENEVDLAMQLDYMERKIPIYRQRLDQAFASPHTLNPGYLPSSKYLLCRKVGEQQKSRGGLLEAPRPTSALHEYEQAFRGFWPLGTRLFVVNPQEAREVMLPDGTVYHLVNREQVVLIRTPVAPKAPALPDPDRECAE